MDTFLPAPTSCPAVCKPATVVKVDGPVMANELRSSRSWQMLLEHLHIFILHSPAADDIKIDIRQVTQIALLTFTSPRLEISAVF